MKKVLFLFSALLLISSLSSAQATPKFSPQVQAFIKEDAPDGMGHPDLSLNETLPALKAFALGILEVQSRAKLCMYSKLKMPDFPCTWPLPCFRVGYTLRRGVRCTGFCIFAWSR